MLAHYFHRLGHPTRYARTPPMHPLALMVQAMLHGQYLRDLPMQFEGHEHRQDVRSMQGMLQAMHAGDYFEFPRFLNTLRGAGLVPGVIANELPQVASIFQQRMQLPHEHPLIQAYTRGTQPDHLANAASRDALYGATPWSVLKARIGQGSMTGNLPTMMDLQQMRPQLHDASRTGGLWHIVEAMKRAHAVLGMHGRHGPISGVHNLLGHMLDANVRQREQYPAQLANLHAGQDTRPNEMVPEDYHAGGM